MNSVKPLVPSVTFFALVFITIYFSAQSSSLQPSSSCLDCSYIEDILFFSIITTLVIPLIILIQKRAKLKQVLLSIIIAAIFFIIVFLGTLNVFQDRVSSWSSFSTSEELLSVLFESYPYLFLGTVIIFLLSRKALNLGKK